MKEVNDYPTFDYNLMKEIQRRQRYPHLGRIQRIRLWLGCVIMGKKVANLFVEK